MYKESYKGWTLVPLLRLRSQWVHPNKNKLLSQSLPAGLSTQHVLAGAHGCPTRAQVWLLWSQGILTVRYLEALSRTRKSLVSRRAGPDIQDQRWAFVAQSSVMVMTSYSMPWCCSCWMCSGTASSVPNRPWAWAMAASATAVTAECAAASS